MRSYGCGSCHAISGVRGADGLVGPSLSNFGDRRTIAGRLPNTPENLTRWILDPQRVKPGDAMPDVGLDRREARDIAAFLDAGAMMRRALLVGALLALAMPVPPVVAATRSPGETLYGQHCAGCHGFAGSGTSSRGPSLDGAGAAAVDFYLTTGRMPLSHPKDVPTRKRPAFSPADIDRIVAYVASLGAGPAIPVPHPASANLAEGMHAFTSQCAGCHQITGRGGILPTTGSPSLSDATATQIAEAVRVGPYLMPRFGTRQLSDRELDSIIRYVLSVRSPTNAGGLGIGNTGPVPEGAVGWLVGMLSLVVVARVLGKPARDAAAPFHRPRPRRLGGARGCTFRAAPPAAARARGPP